MLKELVYFAEDDVHIAQLVKYNLELSGFEVIVFDNTEALMSEIINKKPTILLLDIMLPVKDGIEVLKELRTQIGTKSLPIILLTAKGDELDRVIGLELGADDYITKPFSVRELTARIKAVLRRGSNEETQKIKNTIKSGAITINEDSHRVFINQEELELTLKEFELLKLLMKNNGNVVKRDYILDTIWGYDSTIETRTVDVHIRRLRQLIGEDNIETVRGVGYRFK